MIYVAVIVAICLAELLIRRYINQNVEEDGQKWGKCGVRLRKYHNYGMANDTLRKRPMIGKNHWRCGGDFSCGGIFIPTDIERRKGRKMGTCPDPWRWSG